MSRQLRACLRPLVVIGVVGASLFGTFTAAQAAPSQEAKPQAAGQCPPSGTPCCALGAGNPRMIEGRVVGQARLDCNFVSETMWINVTLHKNGVQQDAEATIGIDVSSVGPVNVDAPCSNGGWQTKVTGHYVLPWGQHREFSAQSAIRNPCLIVGPPPPCPNPPHCQEP